MSVKGTLPRLVIGGTAAFVVVAVDFTDYARAIREKLLRELPAPVADLRQRRPSMLLSIGSLGSFPDFPVTIAPRPKLDRQRTSNATRYEVWK